MYIAIGYDHRIIDGKTPCCSSSISRTGSKSHRRMLLGL
jgi:hypothetical protein